MKFFQTSTHRLQPFLVRALDFSAYSLLLLCRSPAPHIVAFLAPSAGSFHYVRRGSPQMCGTLVAIALHETLAAPAPMWDLSYLRYGILIGSDT